jgi:uncharacterized protein related to proFAR isomerase
MTIEEALRYARMRRTDLYSEDGFEESRDHETIAEVLAAEVERLRALVYIANLAAILGHGPIEVDRLREAAVAAQKEEG